MVEDRVWDEPVDGFFLAIGHTPNTKAYAGQLDLAEVRARWKVAGQDPCQLLEVAGVFFA